MFILWLIFAFISIFPSSISSPAPCLFFLLTIKTLRAKRRWKSWKIIKSWRRRKDEGVDFGCCWNFAHKTGTSNNTKVKPQKWKLQTETRGWQYCGNYNVYIHHILYQLRFRFPTNAYFCVVHAVIDCTTLHCEFIAIYSFSLPSHPNWNLISRMPTVQLSGYVQLVERSTMERLWLGATHVMPGITGKLFMFWWFWCRKIEKGKFSH